MIHGITYSDENMSISAQKCKESMLANVFDQATAFSPYIINEQFKQFNRDIFQDGVRGASCYWLFKPYLIYLYLLELKDGDFLVYSDAGCEWIADPRHITDVMEQDVFLFSNGHQHVHWCKGSVMEAICPDSYSVRPSELYTSIEVDEQQVQASVIFIRVGEFSRKFIKEWLLWCQMPGFIDDSPTGTTNHPEFAEHRHDQAILTCLAIKYEIKLHWWPDAMWYESQRYRWPEDKYPSMVKHHRRRNNEY